MKSITAWPVKLNSPGVRPAFHSTYKVCNRTIATDTAADTQFCNYCRFNEIIPDLSVEGNQDLWYRLEKAKRRLRYTLDSWDCLTAAPVTGLIIHCRSTSKGTWSRRPSGAQGLIDLVPEKFTPPVRVKLE